MDNHPYTVPHWALVDPATPAYMRNGTFLLPRVFCLIRIFKNFYQEMSRRESTKELKGRAGGSREHPIKEDEIQPSQAPQASVSSRALRCITNPVSYSKPENKNSKILLEFDMRGPAEPCTTIVNRNPTRLQSFFKENT